MPEKWVYQKCYAPNTRMEEYYVNLSESSIEINFPGIWLIFQANNTTYYPEKFVNWEI